jgi:hypothetical protein
MDNFMALKLQKYGKELLERDLGKLLYGSPVGRNILTRRALKMAYSGYKKTPITALFSHLKHPFTKNSLVSSRLWRDESLVLVAFL